MKKENLQKVLHSAEESAQLPEVQSDETVELSTQPLPAEETQSEMAEPTNEDIMDSLGFFDINHDFTISKRLSEKEMAQLLRDFDRYTRVLPDDMSRKPISAPKKSVLRNWGFKTCCSMKASMRGYRYVTWGGITWEIKEYQGNHNDIEFTEYFLDINMDAVIVKDWDTDTPPYNGKTLEFIMDYIVKESKDISPLLADLSSYELLNVNYLVKLPLIEDNLKCSAEKVGELIKHSNISDQPAQYREWEAYSVNSSEEPNAIDSRFIMVDCYTIQNYLCFDITRTFSKSWPLKELLAEDSDITKLVIEQMVSKDYLIRSAAIYLKLSVMGGNYCNMDKAIAIIESSISDTDKQNVLLQTLGLVTMHNGIHAAKMGHADNRDKLIEFINNLHDLVELGINPVIIPEDDNIKELPNPILRFEQYCEEYNKSGENKTESSRIDVNEHIGATIINCRLS